ncbi:MAG: META domain-containing protein [Pseudomonadota bacterium]
MMAVLFLMGFFAFQSVPVPDETIRAYGAADKKWRLVELNTMPVAQQVTLSFRSLGRLHSNGPCTSYTARMRVPYPWFALENLKAGKRSCPESKLEIDYVRTLQQATLSEVFGDTLILSNAESVLLVFKADA